MKRPGMVIVILALAVAVCGCSDDGARKIRLHGGEPHAAGSPSGPRLRIAVAAFFSPRKTFFFFQGLLNLLGERSGMEVELVQRQRLDEITDLLQAGELEMALVDSGAYVAARNRFPLEILAVPVVGGRTVCYSYVIVPRNNGAVKFSGLRGKSFAFTDPLSATGRLWPAVLLDKAGIPPERFFAGTVLTWGHDNSIIAVAERHVDGAAVDSLIWQHINCTRPELIARTRIISVSPPLGVPPVVAPLSTPAGIRKRLRNILLRMHEDPKGRRILQETMIDRFVPGSDSMYDGVRRLRDRSAKSNT